VKQAASVAQSNPLGLMIGASAVGFVIGMVIPSTRVEDERIGELADDLKQQVREVGQEAAQRGREVVEQTAQAAGEAAQSAGREQGQELAQSVQQRAQDGSGS
jgi:gas vesicle protein